MRTTPAVDAARADVDAANRKHREATAERLAAEKRKSELEAEMRRRFPAPSQHESYRRRLAAQDARVYESLGMPPPPKQPPEKMNGH